MERVEDHEVYPNAPVVLVVVEVRHSATGPLSPTQQRLVKKRLAQTLPLMRVGKDATFEATFGTGPPELRPAQTTVEEFPKFFSRDRTSAATFRSESMVVETTRYPGWEGLRTLISEVISARLDVSTIDGVERVGLRYIDEIRVPEEPPTDWTSWVDKTLSGPALIGPSLGLSPTQWQGVTLFSSGDNHSVALRHGLRDGYAVNPGGDLARSTPPPGPFFWIDIDSFWSPPGEVPPFDPEMLIATCETLHSPVRELFESLITDRLRTEVLRHGN